MAPNPGPTLWILWITPGNSRASRRCPVDNARASAPQRSDRAVDSGTTEWRVPPAVPAVKLILAAALVVATVTLGRDLISAIVGLAVGAGLGLSGLRDVLVPVRLAAGPDGLTVTAGFGSRRQYPWAQVERVRVDDRRRLLGRSVLLEIDVASDLYFLGRYDLGVHPVEAMDALGTLRPGRSCG